MRTIQLFSLPCLMRALLLACVFPYTLLFTDGYSSGHVKPLTDLILAGISLPQVFAASPVFDALPRAWPMWIKLIPAMIPVFTVSLIEARLFLGLANVTGRIRGISWMGRKNSNPVNHEQVDGEGPDMAAAKSGPSS